MTEKHFLDDCVAEIRQAEGYEKPKHDRKPWYNPYGDSVMCIDCDEETVGCYVDEHLTLYRSAVDGRTIGFKLKDVMALAEVCGGDLTHVAGEYTRDDGNGIKISWLLMAALKKGERPLPQIADTYGELIAEHTKDTVELPAAA